MLTSSPHSPDAKSSSVSSISSSCPLFELSMDNNPNTAPIPIACIKDNRKLTLGEIGEVHDCEIIDNKLVFIVTLRATQNMAKVFRTDINTNSLRHAVPFSSLCDRFGCKNVNELEIKLLNVQKNRKIDQNNTNNHDTPIVEIFCDSTTSLQSLKQIASDINSINNKHSNNNHHENDDNDDDDDIAIDNNNNNKNSSSPKSISNEKKSKQCPQPTTTTHSTVLQKKTARSPTPSKSVYSVPKTTKPSKINYNLRSKKRKFRDLNEQHKLKIIPSNANNNINNHKIKKNTKKVHKRPSFGRKQLDTSKTKAVSLSQSPNLLLHTNKTKNDHPSSAPSSPLLVKRAREQQRQIINLINSPKKLNKNNNNNKNKKLNIPQIATLPSLSSLPTLPSLSSSSSIPLLQRGPGKVTLLGPLFNARDCNDRNKMNKLTISNNLNVLPIITNPNDHHNNNRRRNVANRNQAALLRMQQLQQMLMLTNNLQKLNNGKITKITNLSPIQVPLNIPYLGNTSTSTSTSNIPKLETEREIAKSSNSNSNNKIQPPPRKKRKLQNGLSVNPDGEAFWEERLHLDGILNTHKSCLQEMSNLSSMSNWAHVIRTLQSQRLEILKVKQTITQQFNVLATETNHIKSKQSQILHYISPKENELKSLKTKMDSYKKQITEIYEKISKLSVKRKILEKQLQTTNQQITKSSINLSQFNTAAKQINLILNDKTGKIAKLVEFMKTIEVISNQYIKSVESMQTNVNQFEPSYKSWNAAEVVCWFENVDKGSLNLFQSFRTFKQRLIINNVNGKDLVNLNDFSLKMMGLQEVSDRHLVIKHLNQLLSHSDQQISLPLLPSIPETQQKQQKQQKQTVNNKQHDDKKEQSPDSGDKK